MKKLLIPTIGLLLLMACSKNSNPPSPPTGPAGPFDFLKNSQWVGTFHQTSPGNQYDPPCCLQFNADNTGVILYSFFTFFNQGQTDFIQRDSIKGTIKSINKIDASGNPNPDGNQIGVELTYGETNDGHKITISADRNQMNCVTTEVNKVNAIIYMHMAPFPAAGYTVTGTTWRGKFYDGNSYPDVSGIQFIKEDNIDRTQYYRRGTYIQDGEKKVVKSTYVQKGARVYMSGFNEDNPSPGFVGRFVPYFGVLAPDGKSMWVHSLSDHRRLPTAMGGSQYGPSGSTPIIENK